MTTMLIVNGPPAVGKSTVAWRFLEDHPLALLVDVDALRMVLGQWHALAESRNVARTLALALADAHLEQGFDVIVAQYLGRVEFVEAFAEVAARRRAELVEVILWADHAEILRRFRARREALARSGAMHPERDVPMDELEDRAGEWLARLARIRDERPRTTLIPVRDGVDGTYAAVLARLAGEHVETGTPPPRG